MRDLIPAALAGASTLVLEGRHVRLEPLDMTHVPALVGAAAGPRESYGFTWVPHGEDEVREYVAKAIARRERGEAVPFASIQRETGRVVGSTRFANFEWYDWPPGSELARPVDAVEIGWTWLSASAQRTALNTEAKYLMLRQAFEGWHVHRLTLQTDERNARSRTAIARIGARFEGILRGNRAASDGTLRSTAVYSVVENDWPAVRAALEARLATPSGRPS